MGVSKGTKITMSDGFTPETRLLEQALAGDPDAMEALWVEARRHQDESLMRRLIRQRMDRGECLRLRQDDGEPSTVAELLAGGLRPQPIELCEPVALTVPWDAPRQRLLACDWAEHLAPMFTSEFNRDVGSELDTARRAALGLTSAEALAEAHGYAREDAELFTGLWRPADEALAALLAATDPHTPRLAGHAMRRIRVASEHDNPQYSYEEATEEGQAWLAARLERYLVGPAPSIVWAPDLAGALDNLRDTARADPDALRRALWGIAWFGLEVVIALGEEEIALSALWQGDTLLLEALVDFASLPRIVAPLEVEACWDAEQARAFACDLAAALEPLRSATSPPPLAISARRALATARHTNVETAVLETSACFDACHKALENHDPANARWRQRGWRTQARLLLARLLGREPTREIRDATASMRSVRS